MKLVLKFIGWGIVWMLLLAFSSIQKCSASELWVNVGGLSKHFEDNGRNEVHQGLGVEYRMSSELSAMVGYHKNSLDLRTTYAAVNYQPLNIGPLKIGASVGVMTGYPQKNNGGGFFAAIPLITYEGDKFGANFGVIPDIPNQHVEGAVVLQLKFKAF